MERENFQEARRELEGLTAAAETRVLRWLAARLPSWVNPDHLTGLGLVAMIVAGTSYALSPHQALLLHAVNLCLLINWFGDSLDGTLARYRCRLRPRYGFYVDHMADSVGAFFLLGGLGLSGYIHPFLAAALLVVYLLLAIDSYLATYTLGTFKISHGLVGGTELRLLLVSVNAAIYWWPQIHFFGTTRRLLDVLAVFGLFGLIAVLVTSVIRNTKALYSEEPL